jgi:hypothetical protein
LSNKAEFLSMQSIFQFWLLLQFFSALPWYLASLFPGNTYHYAMSKCTTRLQKRKCSRLSYYFHTNYWPISLLDREEIVSQMYLATTH